MNTSAASSSKLYNYNRLMVHVFDYHPTPSPPVPGPGSTAAADSASLLWPPPISQDNASTADRPSTLPVIGANGAPAPPPRPRGHSRSSSLDNQLDLQTGEGQCLFLISTFTVFV